MGLTPRGAARPSEASVPPAGLPARRAAAAILFAVLEQNRPLDDALAEAMADAGGEAMPGRDRAFARLLVATALRRLGEIGRASCRERV